MSDLPLLDSKMGRARLTMDLIPNKKSRNTTFQKRKNGLKKKMYEFSTLCGVAVYQEDELLARKKGLCL